MSISHTTMHSTCGLFPITLFLLLSFRTVVSTIDYGAALHKSLLYFEAQRSGKLPPNQRVKWRGDSALNDGKDVGVDLVGGYYDAGDNIKFGFPMAFTVTMLSWGVAEFGTKLEAKKELSNALEAIKWGTDYFIKAHPKPNVLYGQVGDNADHECWQRPEDMTTPRTSYKIDEQNPGADLAGETAAALAAASIAFNRSNPSYSSQLITHAKQLFDFATKHHGNYQNSIPIAGQFYSSSGFEDELLWAAVWLYKATNEETYINYVKQSPNHGGTRAEFSWNDKYVGAQVLIAQGILEGKFQGIDKFNEYKSAAEQYICNCIQKGRDNVKKTSAGLLWWQNWNNAQYVTAALFVATTYADTLTVTKRTMECLTGPTKPEELITFVNSQVDHVLGSNPKGMSYMVGYGSKYPQKVHHRGASIVSIKDNSAPVTCKGGFEYCDKDAPNPNILEGAIVGAPDLNDAYNDSRKNYEQAEAGTVNTAPLVGVLARLA